MTLATHVCFFPFLSLKASSLFYLLCLISLYVIQALLHFVSPSANHPLIIVSSFVWFCLPREQFLKSNAQLTFRCRQLLSELSYIYPIDVVSWNNLSSPALHIFDCKELTGVKWKALILQKCYRQFELCFGVNVISDAFFSYIMQSHHLSVQHYSLIYYSLF